MTPLLEARAVRKVYAGGDGSPVEVLDGVDLTVDRGEIVSIVGASGSGKSTLLNLLGALDTLTDGDIRLDGRSYATMRSRERDALRNRQIGFVFQFHHLLRDFTALENVMMPLLIGGVAEREAARRATEILKAVGLDHRLTHRPAQLSGGEQQRCAVARAMAPEPALLLADEPSGNLDHLHSDQLHTLLFDLVRRTGATLIVVTHNGELADSADRTLRLQDGSLSEAPPSEVLLR